MNYIRTKDGEIFEVMSEPDENEWYEQKNEIICLPKKKILKQADTVEELCDEFVVIGMSKNHIERAIYNEFDKELFTNLKCNANGFEIYGAIWTNKGLIYKARMKGISPNGGIDWELL